MNFKNFKCKNCGTLITKISDMNVFGLGTVYKNYTFDGKDFTEDQDTAFESSGVMYLITFECVHCEKQITQVECIDLNIEEAIEKLSKKEVE